MAEPRKKLRPSGGHRGTANFQTATLTHDATYWFCEKFLDPRSRTVDQMVQAARSGRQSFAAGSRAGGFSASPVGSGSAGREERSVGSGRSDRSFLKAWARGLPSGACVWRGAAYGMGYPFF